MDFAKDSHPSLGDPLYLIRLPSHADHPGSLSAVVLPPPERVIPQVVHENDEARRLRKRRAAVEAVKNSPEYAFCSALDLSMVGAGSPEPNPEDLTISKRSWEAAVMAWRNGLRDVMHGRYEGRCV